MSPRWQPRRWRRTVATVMGRADVPVWCPALFLAGALLSGISDACLGIGQAAAEVPLEAGASARQIRGEFVKAQGRYYVVKDAKGKERSVLVSGETAQADTVKPGSAIEVWTSPVDHAIAIRALAEVIEDIDRHATAVYSDSLESSTRTVAGRLTRVDGEYFMVTGLDGMEYRILVDQDTELAGEFGPGDRLEVFTAPIDHAVVIRAVP